MKKIVSIIAILTIGFFVACSNDDASPLIVQTDDFFAELAISAIVGDTIGIVPGTSNQGTINYSINSQTPEGIFTIGQTYGELIVASDAVANLPIDSKVTLEVSVSKEGVSQISNVEITVVPPPVDISPWVGTVVVTEDLGFFVSMVEVPTSDLDNGILELSGGDPFDFFCSAGTPTVIIKFGQLTSATEGPVTVEKQNFPCYGGSETMEGTGTYNTVTKVITLDFTYSGSFPISGTKVITPKE
ncbi:cadherin repeat domain-containing protein [Flavivirga eckloniae]|nr:cadherin repeat domain-containing protein [Flavivirga eckloniae]